MNIINNKNRGMLLEKIINNTINYYNNNKIAFFSKKNLDVKFKTISKDNNKLNLISAFVSQKSTVDYYGVYNGKYVTFEAKSTDEDIFYIKNIKEHQHHHLQLIDKLGGIAFYLIMFKRYSKIFLVNINDIDFSTKSYSLKDANDNWKSIEITFPGIIDFLEIL